MSNENPYSAPITESPKLDPPEPVTASDSIWPIAKKIFLAWEKLRLIYIVILIAVSVSFAISQGHLFTAEFCFVAILGGIFCNACFLAGPFVETYVAWLGLRTRELRFGMFIVGTLMTAAVAVAALSLEFQNIGN